MSESYTGARSETLEARLRACETELILQAGIFSRRNWGTLNERGNVEVVPGLLDVLSTRLGQAAAEVRAAASALASRAAAPQAWQPIETAPKDGTPVWLKWAGTSVTARGYWNAGRSLRYASADWRDVEGDDLLSEPTHWAAVSGTGAQEPTTQESE